MKMNKITWQMTFVDDNNFLEASADQEDPISTVQVTTQSDEFNEDLEEDSLMDLDGTGDSSSNQAPKISEDQSALSPTDAQALPRFVEVIEQKNLILNGMKRQASSPYSLDPTRRKFLNIPEKEQFL